jgi:hypothetical protein
MTVINLEKRLVQTLPSFWAALPPEAQDSLRALLSSGAVTGKVSAETRSEMVMSQSERITDV